MNWTKQKPTKSGYYLLMRVKEMMITVVQVHVMGSGRIWNHNQSHYFRSIYPRKHDWWCGPIDVADPFYIDYIRQDTGLSKFDYKPQEE